MRRRLLAVLVSGFLLVALLAVVGPAAFADRLLAADLRWVAVGLASMTVSIGCWSVALRPLLRTAGGPVSATEAGLAYTASLFGRQVLPVGAIAGPAITAYTVDRVTTLSYDETLAVVTVAEFVSTVASLLLATTGLVWLAWSSTLDADLWTVVGVLLTFAGFLVVAAVFVWYRRSAVDRLVRATARAAQYLAGIASPKVVARISTDRAERALARFYSTVDVVRGGERGLLESFIYHQTGWVFLAIPLAACAWALNVTVPIGLVLFVVPASLLVDVLPLPGGLGGVEVALVGLLVLLGGQQLAGAVAVVFLYRVCSYWYVVLVGGAAVVYSSIRTRELLTGPPP